MIKRLFRIFFTIVKVTLLLIGGLCALLVALVIFIKITESPEKKKGPVAASPFTAQATATPKKKGSSVPPDLLAKTPELPAELRDAPETPSIAPDADLWKRPLSEQIEELPAAIAAAKEQEDQAAATRLICRQAIIMAYLGKSPEEIGNVLKETGLHPYLTAVETIKKRTGRPRDEILRPEEIAPFAKEWASIHYTYSILDGLYDTSMGSIGHALYYEFFSKEIAEFIPGKIRQKMDLTGNEEDYDPAALTNPRTRLPISEETAHLRDFPNPPNYANVRPWMEEFVKRNPRNTIFRTHYAWFLFWGGHKELALRQIDIVLALEPGNASAWANRAHFCNSLGNPAETLGSANRSLALLPGAPFARLARASMLRRLGHAELSQNESQAFRQFVFQSHNQDYGWYRDTITAAYEFGKGYEKSRDYTSAALLYKIVYIRSRSQRDAIAEPFINAIGYSKQWEMSEVIWRAHLSEPVKRALARHQWPPQSENSTNSAPRSTWTRNEKFAAGVVGVVAVAALIGLATQDSGPPPSSLNSKPKEKQRCYNCGGSGQTRREIGNNSIWSTCGRCYGAGLIDPL